MLRGSTLLPRRSHCVLLVLVSACIPLFSIRFSTMASLKPDPTSLSNPLDVKVVSSHLALRVDFAKKILAGHVDHHTEVLKAGSSTLVLDSKALSIKKVSLVAQQAEESLEYKLGTPSDVFGIPVEITIPSNLRTAGSSFTARVHYETTIASSALQWLDPKQTAGKAHPYLFSQCQAIHARSMVPCQDTPSNKIKYTAAITIASPLTALMSATPTGKPTTNNNETTFDFVQDVPIPTYLIAIAAGNLESRDIGPRSKVWSEPEMVEKGAYEFANTEKFIKTGEDLLTPYVWGRYDILLLPPSFPYGGMENPQLTFVTPTLLAGDRSLENVVAHEIAHSWMGNLVTNRYWSEFFLNEGFTVFIERKILSRLNNADYFDFEALGGLKHLQDDINHFGATNPLTALRPKMDGIDPDDVSSAAERGGEGRSSEDMRRGRGTASEKKAFSSVPYEKGFNLLCYLQSLVGVERFEKWLKAYVTKFQYQSITADQMKEFFLSQFTDVPDLDKKIDWDSWFDKPGMPVVKIDFSTKLADSAIALAKKWVEQGGQGTSPDDLKNFSSGQKTTFLDQLLVLSEAKPLSNQTIEAIDEFINYNFTATKNSEIRLRWYTLCIKAGYNAIFPHVVQFLTEQGRMKFVRPLYRELHKNGEGKKLAEDTFRANRDSYHSIAARQLAKDLSVEQVSQEI